MLQCTNVHRDFRVGIHDVIFRVVRQTFAVLALKLCGTVLRAVSSAIINRINGLHEFP